jgi:catechol 2,3-dioxygenase-like lactoylglutathione lyase family enzyme
MARSRPRARAAVNAARLVQFFVVEANSMSEFRWDHLHLRSPDPEATARYYVDVFGATPVNKVNAGGALRVIVNLAGLNLFIEQVSPETPAPPHPPHLGLEHIGLAVTNIDAVCAELKARGAEFTVEPHSPRPGLWIAFVRAPENVRIEVLERSTGT